MWWFLQVQLCLWRWTFSNFKWLGNVDLLKIPSRLKASRKYPLFCLLPVFFFLATLRQQQMNSWQNQNSTNFWLALVSVYAFYIATSFFGMCITSTISWRMTIEHFKWLLEKNDFFFFFNTHVWIREPSRTPHILRRARGHVKDGRNPNPPWPLTSGWSPRYCAHMWPWRLH